MTIFKGFNLGYVLLIFSHFLNCLSLKVGKVKSRITDIYSHNIYTNFDNICTLTLNVYTHINQLYIEHPLVKNNLSSKQGEL